MKKKIVVFGCNGQMGRVICHGFSKLGYHVIGVDKFDKKDAEADMTWRTKSYVDKCFHCDVEDGGLKDLNIYEDVVATVSALPYFLNGMVATHSMQHGVPYFDLGGKVCVSRGIQTLSETYRVPCFTDLGLAPGWVNIVAEHAYETMNKVGDVKTIGMAVGGIPDYTDGFYCPPLNYEITWSVDGLLNEYRDDCIILEDGEIVTVEGMDGYETMNIDGTPFEMFYTSGGASHTIPLMKERGVQGCSYRTIRFQGHRNTMVMLMNSLEDKDIRKILDAECRNGSQDAVIIAVAAGVVNQPSITFEFLQIITADDDYTAMQKCTAFPLVAAVHVMLLDGLERKVLTYTDINYVAFSSLLSVLLEQDVQ